MDKTIAIEVVYVPLNGTAWHCFLERPTPYTAEQALTESGVLLAFPEIDLAKSHKMGIFGRFVSPQTPLKHHDRLEIYRPLAQDPKVLRIKRAREQKNGQQRNHKA